MRTAPALFGLAALAFAASASAQTLEQVSYSPAFQAELEDDLGMREGEYLRENVTRAIERAIARRNVAQAPLRIEVVIEDAQPNRFTTQQLRTRPGVDPIRSVSVGGAELRAVLRGADGAVLAEVEHRRYSTSLRDLFFEPLTWTDANRAIRQFAEKVADAYVAHAGAR
jgi:outer membrane receptor protein involved in Fe transport